MTTIKGGEDTGNIASDVSSGLPRQPTPAAERALKEAAERRAQREAAAQSAAAAAELGGRSGPDPVRYGDWENGGIVSDF